MGPRVWAAIGNVLRLSAVAGYLGGAVFGYRALQLSQLGTPGNAVFANAAGSVTFFVVAVILWNLKGPLVSGNLIVRLLVGLYMLSWIISTLGLGLLFIGIVYLFTGEPNSSEVSGRARTPKPRFRAPAHWRATGRVGPSGATFYVDAVGGDAGGILNSFTPVQVTDRRDGLAHVVAATGERGWIDMRTLTEGV